MICEICGIDSSIKPIIYNRVAEKYLCNKHNMQFRQFGKFTDNNSHSRKDPNTYRIIGDYIEVDCYDISGNINGVFIADLEDLHYVQEHNWRICPKRNSIYIVTGNNKNFPITYFHRLVMNYTGDLEIDHINGNTLDNRKNNLRLADRKLQARNMGPKINNKFGVRGISYDKRYCGYIVDFTIDKRRIYIKPFKTLEEAVYARYLLELKYNPDRRITNDDLIFSYINKLDVYQKYNIESYINKKLNEGPINPLIFTDEEENINV